MTDDHDQQWMRRALVLAEKAESEGEVPVGAVIIKEGEIIAEGWNQPISAQDPTAHAEIMAVRAAAAHTENYRLPGTTLYVTLEPCVMCAGAIIHARIDKVVFGAADPKAGASGSVFDILGTDNLNHKVAVTGGVLKEECAAVLQEFFKARRQ